MKKQILRFVLTMICCMCLLSWQTAFVKAEYKVSKKTLALGDTSIKNVYISAEDCNIKILMTEEEDIYCEYNKKLCKVSMKLKEDDVKISICGTSKEAQSVKDVQIYYLYLPKELNADEVSIDLKSGSGSAVLQTASAKEVSIKRDGGSLRTPSGWKKINNNKDTRVSITIEDCMYSIEKSESSEGEHYSVVFVP